MAIADIDDLRILVLEHAENDRVRILGLVEQDVCGWKGRTAKGPEFQVAVMAERDIVTPVDHPRPQHRRLAHGPALNLRQQLVGKP